MFGGDVENAQSIYVNPTINSIYTVAATKGGITNDVLSWFYKYSYKAKILYIYSLLVFIAPYQYIWLRIHNPKVGGWSPVHTTNFLKNY